MRKTYAFLNHARERDPENVISRIETSMKSTYCPTETTSEADVMFVHLPADELESVLSGMVEDGEVNVNSTIVLCSSHPYGMWDVLNSLQKFPDRHVLGDPFVFQGVIGEFMTGLAAGKVRTDLLASRAPPEALVGLYLLMKGGMDEVSMESYRAANGEKLHSEARAYLREGEKIETIDANVLSDALARAFER